MPAPIEIDAGLVQKLASIQCTDAEIAAVCGCSETTVKRRCREALDVGRAHANVSLRRVQWKAARKGNIVMMIWLGKQYLGQTDKQEISEHGGTLRVVERIEPAGGSGADHGSPDAPAT